MDTILLTVVITAIATALALTLYVLGADAVEKSRRRRDAEHRQRRENEDRRLEEVHRALASSGVQ